jgi:hypothetical protein
MEIRESPFQDLPEALVEEMLLEYKKLGHELSESFEEIRNSKDKIRETLKTLNLIKSDSELITTHAYPTTCGIDGAYAVERLLSTDIAAVAGVAIEGLSPPTETRLWPKPHHLCSVFAARHHETTSLVISAIMHTMELELVTKAPHDVIFLDGSLTTPMIRFNQAFNMINDAQKEISQIFLHRIESALNSYIETISAKRTDKIYAGVPKYTTKNEISKRIGLAKHEDRALLSFVLKGGELVGPTQFELPEHWHINIPNWPKHLKNKAEEIMALMKELRIIYYRPYEYLPALRIELPPSIATNKNRLSMVLESLQLQCGAPSIMEPYPLYLADRMVKHLGTALPAMRKSATQDLASSLSEELGNVFLAMHGYRTEYGR